MPPRSRERQVPPLLSAPGLQPLQNQVASRDGAGVFLWGATCAGEEEAEVTEGEGEMSESKLHHTGKPGRPSRLSEGDKHEVRRYRESGVSIARLALMWEVSTTRVYEILAEQRAKFGPEQLPKDRQRLARRHLFEKKTVQATYRPTAYVYVFKAHDLVKIGCANDVQSRWRSLRTSNPMIEPPIYSTEKLEDAYAIELKVHRELAEHRVKGTEWFRCPADLAVQVVQRISRMSMDNTVMAVSS